MNTSSTTKEGWARAKALRQEYGFTSSQLKRYASDGLIRSSHILRPGQKRGVRLFNKADIEMLINESIEPSKKPMLPE